MSESLDHVADEAEDSVVQIALAKELKQMEFDRVDRAIRTQIAAIVKAVTVYARAGRQRGVTDYAGFREAIDQLNAHLLGWEVSAALKDYQVEALYDASFALNAACKAGAAKAAAEPDAAAIKESFERGCESLRKFWVSMGESTT
ncbi:MAG TPA: hypothetical protein VMF11_02105 [Candidatus Baltobacteraceae bacterium]|nr:hypothetical protein [Candidatus Baltobacteraceae bacterium]